jgi:hypothetical protein
MKKDSLANLAMDTLIVLAGFAIAMVAAGEFFVNRDPAVLLVFLFGFIVVCFGMGRRMAARWY